MWVVAGSAGGSGKVRFAFQTQNRDRDVPHSLNLICGASGRLVCVVLAAAGGDAEFDDAVAVLAPVELREFVVCAGEADF